MTATPNSPIKPIAGRNLLIAIGVAILVYAFATQFLPLLRSAVMDGARQQVLLIFFLAINVAALGLAITAVRGRFGGYSWADLGVRPVSDYWMRLAFGLGLAAVPIVLVASIVLREMFNISSPRDNPLAPAGFSWLAAATIILYAGLLVPIFEELFFRGLLFSWLRNRLPAASAIPISAGAFAILHLRAEIMIFAFLIGCVLAWLYERSRSVLPCILLHQTFNTTQLVFLYVITAMKPAGAGLSG